VSSKNDPRPLFHALASARARLVDAGISPPDAAVDVDLYARAILGWDHARLLAEQQQPVPDGLEPRLSEWVARRERHEPSAYIVGSRQFWGLDFAVSPAVLIPRPETEFIVEEVLALRSGGLTPASDAVRVADIGTGSGCVAIAVATELPRSRIVASDVSEEALVVARENAVRHGVGDRIEFVKTSYLDDVDGSFDVITANPPYVKETDRPGLSRGVRHEPEVALFGGVEGLRDIAGVMDTAVRMLTAGGWLVMEFGYGQEPDVEALVEQRPALALARVRGDLQGIPRTAIIQRR